SDLRRQLPGKLANRDQHGAVRVDVGSILGFVGDRSGTAGNRIGDMRTAVLLQSRNGQEEIPRTYLAAIQGKFPYQYGAAGLRQQLIKRHRHQLRPPLPFAASAVCSGTGGGRLSGATFSRRSARATTLPNTGAATRPP